MENRAKKQIHNITKKREKSLNDDGNKKRGIENLHYTKKCEKAPEF